VLVVALASGFFVWRYAALRTLEPREDQAAFAHWVKDLKSADHFLPHRQPGESWRTALEADHASFLNRYLIRIYNRPHWGLGSVGLFIVYLLSFVAGDSYAAQVAISMLASAGVLIVLGLCPSWLQRRDSAAADTAGGDGAVGVVALLLAGTAAYLHFFSALGMHNFGILALTAAVAFVSSGTRHADARANWTPVLLAAGATCVAIYSHWTNVFLLPPALAAQFAFFGQRSWRRRVRDTLIFTAIVGVSVVPIGVFIMAGRSAAAASDFSYAGFTAVSAPTLIRSALSGAVSWFSAGASMFSAPGLACALAGLVLLARARREVLPLLIVGAHWLAWTIMPGFRESWLRTYPYVLPLFCLGAAFLLVSAFRGELRDVLRWPLPTQAVRAAAVVLITVHAVTQARVLSSSTELRRIPEAWATFSRGQGRMRPMVREIDARLPVTSTLLTWNYPLQDLYVTLSERGAKDVVVPPALNAMWTRYQSGGLQDYLARRRPALSCRGPLFVLADRTIPLPDVERALSDVLHVADATCGALTVVAAGSWQTQSDGFGDIVLYALR
jgi:hypothetical protein